MYNKKDIESIKEYYQTRVMFHQLAILVLLAFIIILI